MGGGEFYHYAAEYSKRKNDKGKSLAHTRIIGAQRATTTPILFLAAKETITYKTIF